MSDIIERAEKALVGVYEEPWHVVGFGNINATDAAKPPIAKAWNTANSKFIAAARSLVPELVAQLKAARAEIAEQKEWIKELTTSDE